LIIEQLILAHTYHRAETSGASLEGLKQPRSVGYGIGLAVGLFAMEFTGAIFEYQSAQIAAVQGCCLRAAVSAPLNRVTRAYVPQVVDLISRKSMYVSFHLFYMRRAYQQAIVRKSKTGDD
jgi:ATP-binding cassette subfamily C (CFTR/MRP) protein 1